MALIDCPGCGNKVSDRAKMNIQILTICEDSLEQKESLPILIRRKRRKKLQQMEVNLLKSRINGMDSWN